MELNSLIAVIPNIKCFIVIMIIKQIIYLSSFVLWVLSYSYLLVTPGILLSNSFILKQAKILQEDATRQFNNGAINYLEWLMLVHQSIGIQSDYLNAISEWNKNIIELNSYSNN